MRSAGRERSVLGAGFLVPQGCILLAMAGVPLVPVILLAALVVQLRAEGLLTVAKRTPLALSEVEVRT